MGYMPGVICTDVFNEISLELGVLFVYLGLSFLKRHFRLSVGFCAFD